MISAISQTMNRLAEDGHGLCTRVHGVGLEPSIMNRFMQTNWHEVLFVT
jgi:hypothetical protein